MASVRDSSETTLPIQGVPEHLPSVSKDTHSGSTTNGNYTGSAKTEGEYKNGDTSTETGQDPFLQTPDQRPHRFSQIDSQTFAASMSPSQAKRALQAHLAETDRRIQEASKLGTTLVDQRRNLTERLRDIEGKQNDNEIGPELRRKLADIEKEYNEVGRESARAFLGPKSRVSSAEGGPNSPFKSERVRQIR